MNANNMNANANHANQTPIIAALTPTEFQQLLTNAKNSIIVVKFGAEWCKPCKLIKGICAEWAATRPTNVIYADINIDDSMELYGAFKTKKMVRGIPVILAFNTELPRDQWYIPDFSVEGGDVEAVTHFLQTTF
jgi:thioredoxin-like negative regulator of GroEL